MNLRQIYRWPAILAIILSAGLCFALLGDGPWDVASWILLSLPLLLLLYLLALSKPIPPGSSTPG